MALHVHGNLLASNDAVETPFPGARWVVLKFGGSSVATLENWQTIADILRARLKEGLRPLVCHSALAGVSNRLIELIAAAVSGEDIDERIDALLATHQQLADQLGISAAPLDEVFANLRQLAVGVKLIGEASPRVHARILATGEIAATKLGAAFLQASGLDAKWQFAPDLLKALNDSGQPERSAFLAAHCDYSPDALLESQLETTEGIVITQGFIASNADGDVVLLGRGGSDTSGAYFASKLSALRLEIWTDVPGFFSADPRAVPAARLIRQLHYSEAQEISSAGGGVLHPRSISPMRRSGIPLFLKCTAHPEWDGSVISAATGEDTPQLKAISHRNEITLIAMESFEMWHQVGFLADAFECFRRHGVSVDLISTSESNVTVTIDKGANVTSQAAIDALTTDLNKLCRVTIVDDCSAVTLIGRRIRASLHELAPALEVFEEHRVHLVTQAANDLNLTVVVDSEHAHRFVKTLHQRLVSRLHGGVFGPTWAEFAEPQALREPVSTSAWWRERRDTLIEIAQDHEAVYVYDRASIAKSAQALRSLKSVDRVFYAMKANSNPDVLREIASHGIQFECVSPGEVARVREVIPDIDPQRILFTPNFAQRKEYEWALAEGFWLTLDSLYPLQAWGKIFKDQEVLIRIDPGKGRGHHEHVKTAGVQSKFGVPMFELDELLTLATEHEARIVGLHAHVGSGVLDPDAWGQTGEQLAEVVGQFPHLRFLDLGGGLGIPEKPGQSPLDMAALDAGIARVRVACPSIEIWLEPGRYLVAQAGVLLARVTQKKGKGHLQYLGVTTGMNSLIRPALYGAYHEIVNLSKINESASELTTVVGPICESADKLGSDRLLPLTDEGDVLLVANTGAYGYVMSSRYNLREVAKEILL